MTSRYTYQDFRVALQDDDVKTTQEVTCPSAVAVNLVSTYAVIHHHFIETMWFYDGDYYLTNTISDMEITTRPGHNGCQIRGHHNDHIKVDILYTGVLEMWDTFCNPTGLMIANYLMTMLCALVICESTGIQTGMVVDQIKAFIALTKVRIRCTKATEMVKQLQDERTPVFKGFNILKSMKEGVLTWKSNKQAIQLLRSIDNRVTQNSAGIASTLNTRDKWAAFMKHATKIKIQFEILGDEKVPMYFFLLGPMIYQSLTLTGDALKSPVLESIRRDPSEAIIWLKKMEATRKSRFIHRLFQKLTLLLDISGDTASILNRRRALTKDTKFLTPEYTIKCVQRTNHDAPTYETLPYVIGMFEHAYQGVQSEVRQKQRGSLQTVKRKEPNVIRLQRDVAIDDDDPEMSTGNGFIFLVLAVVVFYGMR